MHCRHVSHVSPQVLTGGSIVISTVAKHAPSTLYRKGRRLVWCNMEGKMQMLAIILEVIMKYIVSQSQKFASGVSQDQQQQQCCHDN